VNSIRIYFDLPGTPIRITLREKVNPFAHKRNPLAHKRKQHD
jgi:GTP-binding protein